MDAQSLAAHRQQFPALANKIYLNYGGQGPLPQVAATAITTAYQFEQTHGPFSTKVSHWIQDHIQDLRSALAATVQTTPDRIMLNESTTTGMNIPLWGLDWQAGDQILVSDAEHPGVLEIIGILSQRFGVELIECPLMLSQDPVAVLQRYLTPRTRMAVICHVFWNTGEVMPLADLVACCHDRGVLVHVDAAQSAGVLPLNLPETGVDFYAFTGHKWCCGPAGLGALYLSAAAQAQIQPTYVGWRSGKAAGTAGEYEIASIAWPLLAGLRAALACHDQVGSIQERYHHQVQLAQRLWHQLAEVPGLDRITPTPPQTGLVAFTLEGKDPIRVERELEQRQIVIRSLPHPVCLRVSVHYLTTEMELDQLVDALNDLMKS